MWAAEMGNIRTVKYLVLKCNADINTTNKVCCVGSIEIVRRHNLIPNELACLFVCVFYLCMIGVCCIRVCVCCEML